MSEIIPAILAKDNEEFKRKLEEIPKEAPHVHIDILEDDTWVDMEKTFEVHIMSPVVVPKAETWLERGAKRLVMHKLEPEILGMRGKTEIGLAVELNIPLEDVYPVVEQVDFLHLMSIESIGAQGRPFDERIFDRIRDIKSKYPDVVISVDGGIKTSNYQALLDAGADRLVVGSGFKELWNLVTKR